MDDIKIYTRKLIQTENQLTVPISGTGSAGMETCFVNLIEPCDQVLILINGVFGTRMEDVAQRLGAEVDSLKFEWGTPVILDSVREQLAQKKYDLVAVVPNLAEASKYAVVAGAVTGGGDRKSTRLNSSHT